MAKETGLGDQLFVDGIDISGDIQGLGNISGGPAALDMTDITRSAYERLGGLRSGNMDLTSFFNKATSRAHPTLKTLPTTDRILTYLHRSTIGSPGACMVSKQIGYDGNRTQDGQFILAVNGTSNAFGLEWGEQQTPGKRSDTGATNGASLDYQTVVAATTTTPFGGQFYVHLFSFTGTSVTIKLQDAPDNATWADVPGATSGALTTVGSVRAVTTSTENVDRYTRVVTTGTFTQATFVVVFARNLTAVTF